MPATRRGGWTTLVSLVLLCAAAWVQQAHYDFEHDDAYISYRYAANWARGLGPVYNSGERVEGYTNFLLVALLATSRRLGLDIVTTSRTIGTLAAFGLVFLVYHFVSNILRRGAALALVAAAAVALHAAVAVWARSGLETVPFSLAVLGAHTVFAQERRRAANHWRSGLLFGVVALLRADGFLFAAIALGIVLCRGPDRRRLASLAAGYLLLFGPYYVWRCNYYGYPFPNTYYLKTGGDIFQQLRGLFYSYNFVAPFGGVLQFSLPLLLLLRRDRARDDARLVLGAGVLGFGAYIVWVGGDYMPMARLFVPLVAPLQILLLESALEASAGMRGLPAIQRRRIRVALLTCVVAAGFLPTLNSRRLPASAAAHTAAVTRHWIMAGKWLRQHVDPAQVMATSPAGAVAYHSGLRIVDILGVTDIHLAHLQVERMGHGSAGHEKQDFDYILSRRPDLIFRGVFETAETDGSIEEYADGARYRMRCEPLGLGRVATEWGIVRTAELYLWLEERLPSAP